MIVKLLTEYHLEFLGLKGGCRGSSESTLVKMSNCWKSHALAHLSIQFLARSYKNIVQMMMERVTNFLTYSQFKSVRLFRYEKCAFLITSQIK